MTVAHRLGRALTPGRILLGSWLLFLIYAWPGYMSYDSAEQLMQARGIVPLTDAHPPAMALLWRFADRVIAGPPLMLVIQSVPFLLGTAAILRRALSPRAAATAAAIILLAPPVCSQLAVVWKDCQMAGFLIGGTALLLSGRRRWTMVGCLLLVLATAQRVNAPAATPLICALLVVWRPADSRLRQVALGIATWVVITFTGMAANGLADATPTYGWHCSLAILDIVGTVRFAPEMSDEQIRTELAAIPLHVTTDIRRAFARRYSPRQWQQLVVGDARLTDQPVTNEQRLAIQRTWWQLVRQHPRAYLHHRLTMTAELLGITVDPPMGAVFTAFAGNTGQSDAVGERAVHSSIQPPWIAALTWTSTTLLFRPWAYLLLALALLPMARRDRLAAALLLSGISYEVGVAVAAPSADFRYSAWLVTATIVATAVLVARRATRQPPHDVELCGGSCLQGQPTMTPTRGR